LLSTVAVEFDALDTDDNLLGTWPAMDALPHFTGVWQIKTTLIHWHRLLADQQVSPTELAFVPMSN
jgi:hypothetical protein